MNQKLRIGATSIILLSLIGCATTNDPAVTGAKRDVLKTRKTYTQGVVAGAVIGAGTGAGIGALAGSSNGKAGYGALIGGAVGLVVGGLGGLLYAQHVVKQRQMYANAGEYLADCTKVASEHNANLHNYNSTLAKRRASLAKDRELLATAISDSSKVQNRIRSEIKLQEAALAQARLEKVPPSLIRDQVAQIECLKTEDRRLKAEIERLSYLEKDPQLVEN